MGNSQGLRRLIHRLNRATGLRCVLYHEIAESPSVFTEGLGVTTPPSTLAAHLELLGREYRFVSIDWVTSGDGDVPHDRPPLLISFDDAYASVAAVGADICMDAGVPSVFFVNGAFVDNATLAFDNLVAWIVNTRGMAPLVEATGRDFGDLGEFFGSHLPSLSLERRRALTSELARMPDVPLSQMAADASLYVTSQDLASVGEKGMAIGNHTWSHVHCRSLVADDVESEIGRNHRFLEGVADTPVTAFSYPYGSPGDATDAVTSDLVRRGYRSAFLAESRLNRLDTDSMRLSRVSMDTVDAADLFAEIEVLPALRRLRDSGRRSAG